MKTFITVTIAIAAAFFIGWFVKPSDGIAIEEVADLLRSAGDSAVTAYVSSGALEDFVKETLDDTVEYYEAEVRAATKIEIRYRDTTITEIVVQTDTVDVPDSLKVRISLPPFQSGPVTVEETLTVAPNPVFLSRSLAVTFDPDTMIVALLRTPSGVDRFAAALANSTSSVRVVDAAQLKQSRNRTLDVVLDITTVASCAFLGWSIAEEEGTAALVSGGVCGGVSLWKLLRR